MEQPHSHKIENGGQEKLPYDEHVVIEIERFIMEKALGDNTSPQGVSEWVEKYAKRFRDILNECPEIVEVWEKDFAEAVKLIEKRLYN